MANGLRKRGGEGDGVGSLHGLATQPRGKKPGLRARKEMGKFFFFSFVLFSFFVSFLFQSHFKNKFENHFKISLTYLEFLIKSTQCNKTNAPKMNAQSCC